MRVGLMFVAALVVSGCVTGRGGGPSNYATGHIVPEPEFAQTQISPTRKYGGKYFVQALNSKRIWLKSIKVSRSSGFTKRTACKIKFDNELLREGLENLSKNVFSAYYTDVEFGVVGGGSFELYGDNLDALMGVSLVSLKPSGRCSGPGDAITCEYSVDLAFKSQYKTRSGTVKSFEVKEFAEAPEVHLSSEANVCPTLAGLYEKAVKRAFQDAVSKLADMMGRDLASQRGS